MPGVPSSRGCNACRKQKKKCDQSKPACSRCTRLKIDCIGGGQQRYKFKAQTVVNDQVITRKIRQDSLVAPPSNTTTTVLSSFISILGVIDVRYDLTYYGAFLADIPCRLGTNDALDTSVKALIAAFPFMHTKKHTPEMFLTYGRALQTLRTYLSDPEKAHTSSTLCAIYLMDVCQSWIGQRDDLLQTHGEVLAYLLNTAPIEKWRDPFQVEMLITISAAVAIESFANPRIQLDEFFSKIDNVYKQKYGPKTYFSDTGVPLSITLPSLARMGHYFREPELHATEIASVYQELLVDSNTSRQRLIEATESLSEVRTPLQSYPIMKKYIALQASYGLISSLAIILGCILRIFAPDDKLLVEDATRLAGEVIRLAQGSSQYRPLGSCYMPFCLISAWVAADSIEQKAQIERMVEDWQNDFKETRWMNVARWLKGNLDNIRLRYFLSQLQVSSDHTSMVKGYDEVAASSCCIL